MANEDSKYCPKCGAFHRKPFETGESCCTLCGFLFIPKHLDQSYLTQSEANRRDASVNNSEANIY